MKRKLVYGIGAMIIGFGTLVGCGSGSKGAAAEKTTIKFGTCPGPYGDMVKYGIKPSLEEKGYKVEIIEFSDYVQPNLALGKGEVDANIFQHNIYLENFKKEHQLELTKLINIPTAALAFYSNKYKDISEVEEGATFTVPNDVTNLRRALMQAQVTGLLKIDETVEVAKFSEKNILENPLNLKITPVEAAQLPRTLDSADLAAIPGNFALSAGIDLNTAIHTEALVEDMKNIIAVRTSDANSQFAKDILDVVESEAFHQAIESSEYQFSGFQKPDWYITKWEK